MRAKLVETVVILAGLGLSAAPIGRASLLGLTIAGATAIYAILWSGPTEVNFEASDWAPSTGGGYELHLGWKRHGIVNPGHVRAWTLDDSGSHHDTDFEIQIERSTVVLKGNRGGHRGYARIT